MTRSEKEQAWIGRIEQLLSDLFGPDYYNYENLVSTMLVNLEVILITIMSATLTSNLQLATLSAIMSVALLAILTANQATLLTSDCSGLRLSKYWRRIVN